MIRAFVLLLLLSGLGWELCREQTRGRFQRVDETFVDFLLANARGRFTADPAKLGDVVFVRLREEDKKEYETWPPSPGDYLMVAKGLAAFDPAVLVIADPLSWPEPKPERLPELAQVLLPVPSVVLAAEATDKGPANASTKAYVKDHFPALRRLSGQPELLPELPTLTRLPEAELVPQKDIGILTRPPLAIALRDGDHAVPSLTLAALARATRTPYASQRLHTGAGAGLYLGTQWFIPLETDGSLKPTPLPVPTVNGLELMTTSIVGDEADVAKILGKGKTIVVGMDNDKPEPTPARAQAQAIAGALTLPQVRQLGFTGQLIAWVLAGLAGLGLLLLPKKKATLRTLGLLFVVLLASYIAFQVGLIWCPPTAPVALILCAGVFARLFGFDPDRARRRKSGKFYTLR